MVNNWSYHSSFLKIIILLIAFGTLVMYSASSYYAEFIFKNYTHFLIKHMKWLGLGTLGYFIFSRIKYKEIKFSMNWVIIITWLLIILAFILNPTNKPNRWLIIGGKNWLTTSDLARLMLIIYTSYFLDKYQKHINDWSFMLKKYTWIPAITLFMIVFQPDLSSTIVISLIVLTMLIIGKVSFRYIIIIISTGLLCTSIMIVSNEYMFKRFQVWMNQSEEIDQQQHYSMMALGSGKLIGNGIGSSKLAHGHLPAAHTDFILPIVGEEYGFIGISILFGLFGLVFHYGIRIVQIASDRFSLFLALGIILNLIFYFPINVAYVIGFAPNTGLAMPFMSYGGSNIIFMMSSVGLLIGIANQSIKKTPKFLKRTLDV